MRPPRTPPTVLLCLAAGLTLSAAEPRVEFNRDIRPIFSDTCFACHGPDEAKTKGKLRLDSLAAARRGGKSGEPAIVPGHPEQSSVIARLRTTDPDEHMPPAEFHKVLTPSQVELVSRWIAQGAEYQGHWAFQTPVKAPVPPVPAGGNAIDGFIQRTLDEKGLKPNGEADRTVLLRRAALDLTGLPPTDADLTAFLSDRSPDAWSKALDRLLDSPHYGETMAMQWLDFARYADSNGFQSDTTRTMWPWRDWVIRAFNANKPFDQFTIEQLAGDLLPGATDDQIVATGFHRNHRLNGEGGRIVEEWFAESVIDRVETTGSTWMALTMNCCRCHDHKYDPITQKEFYQLFAYFNSIDETGVLGEFGGAAMNRKGGNTPPLHTIVDAAGREKIAAAERLVKEAEAALAATPQPTPAQQAAWEDDLRKKLSDETARWSPLPATSVVSNGGATLTKQADGSWLAGGKNPPKDTYVITAPVAGGALTGLLLEVFPDPSLPARSLGRNSNGNFVLSGVDVTVTAPDGQKTRVALTRAEADYEQSNWNIGALADAAKAAKKKKEADTRRPGWAPGANDPANRVPRRALFALAPTAVPAGAVLTVTLRHETLPAHNIGRFRLSTSGLESTLLSLKDRPADAGLRALLAKPADGRSDDERARLEKLFGESPAHPRAVATARLRQAQEALKTAQSAGVDVMVMKELAAPRDAFVLLRGEYDKIGPKVPRALPAVLPPLPAGEPNNRLGLARWLVNGKHPLTARVWVNRAWERLFGVGLVKTSENFGSQAEWPSHPELLDWLAVDFVERAWDMKAMQKFIMSSAAYRRSAAVTPALLEKDPENRLLARGPRFRLSAEIIRDQALAVSGLLVDKIGGPSVKPYMPEAVWDETSVYGDMRNYKADTGEGLYRRSLYTIWKRTAAPPSMLLFDSSSREICTVKRSRTNTPLQALSLLNEVTYVEAARKLAENALRQPGDRDARLRWAFRRVTRRDAAPAELAVLAKGLDSRLRTYASDPALAARLLANGRSPAPADLPAGELAAWTVTANILLNLDETVTRE